MPVSTIPLASAVSGTLPDGSAPSGSVIQVVTTSSAVNISTQSTNILSLAITPSSTSSRIYLIGNCTVSCNPGSNAYGNLIILRNNTTVITAYSGFNSAIFTAIPIAIQFVDSPSTTSSITYVLNLSRGSGGTSSVTTSGEAYSLTAMEIAG
jgi:hypothetical protein